jgi:hypothetical protein
MSLALVMGVGWARGNANLPEPDGKFKTKSSQIVKPGEPFLFLNQNHFATCDNISVWVHGVNPWGHVLLRRHPQVFISRRRLENRSAQGRAIFRIGRELFDFSRAMARFARVRKDDSVKRFDDASLVDGGGIAGLVLCNLES